MEKVKYRMYGFAPYQLTGIQKSIQHSHACMEHILTYKDDPIVSQYVFEDKTIVLLDGGTTNSNPERMGTMELYYKTLTEDFGVKVTKFHEPDLNDAMLGMCFILPDNITQGWQYPINLNLVKRSLVMDGIDENDFEYAYNTYPFFKKEVDSTVGSFKNFQLRQFISSKRLASN